MFGAVFTILAGTGCDGTEPIGTVAFELDSQLVDTGFWDLPFPSDLRMNPDGTQDFAGFPNPNGLGLVSDLLEPARIRRGAPAMPIAWFKPTVAVPARNPNDVIAPGPDAPVLLVNIDPDSDHRGQMFPTVASVIASDDYVGESLIAVAPRPGIVLDANTTYAFVLMREFADELGPHPAIRTLADGGTLAGARGEAAKQTFAPLWPTLRDLDAFRHHRHAAAVVARKCARRVAPRPRPRGRVKYDAQPRGRGC